MQYRMLVLDLTFLKITYLEILLSVRLVVRIGVMLILFTYVTRPSSHLSFKFPYNTLRNQKEVVPFVNINTQHTKKTNTQTQICLQ